MEDLVSAHVRFDGGLSLQMDGSWCAEEGDSSGFEIVCEKGTMTCGPLKVWVEGADGQVVDETPNLAGVEFARRRVYSLTDWVDSSISRLSTPSRILPFITSQCSLAAR
ncbi:MAG: hypothetical protein VCF24_27420, partial [Candidatus Latescibacterota bacterium]